MAAGRRPSDICDKRHCVTSKINAFLSLALSSPAVPFLPNFWAAEWRPTFFVTFSPATTNCATDQTERECDLFATL